MKKLCLVMLLFVGIIPFLIPQAQNNYPAFSNHPGSKSVVAINPSAFNFEKPETEISKRWRTIMNNTCSYILNEWWTASQCNGNENKYIDFGYLELKGKTGDHGAETKEGIRGPSEHAYTIAVAVFTKAYDEKITGVPEKTAVTRAVTIIKSVAKDHLANSGIGIPWGDHWQSAQWASKCAVAGWLLWDYLDIPDRENVKRMIEHEADRFLDIKPPAANEDYVNDTKAEEDGWQADGIQAACALMPDHPNFNLWLEKAIEYRLTALADPNDLFNNKIIDGKPAYERIAGYNIDTLGALGNHGAYPHPDYMAAPLRHTIEGALFLSLAKIKVPEANKFNCNLVYKNFVDHVWNNESTIYKKDGSIYWPIQIESDRRFEFITFGIIDAGALLWGYDDLSETKASYWEDKHTAEALKLNLTGYIAASAYLLHWINKQ